MAIQIKPIKRLIGGEIDGVDLRRPLSDDDIAAIHAGMDKYAVLIFHGQQMDNVEHLEFTKLLGQLQPNVDTNVTKVEDRRLSVDFSDVSNIGKNHEILERDSRRRMFSLGNRLWHSDQSYRAIPAKYSMLYGHVVPPVGGNTEFAHMGAAYDALDDNTKAEIEDLVCEHSLLNSRAQIGFTDYSEDELPKFKPVLQRLVRHHPAMDRKSLYLASHIGAIVGWPRPEAMVFIRDLMEHATQPEFVYSHRWRQGDLVIWDNPQTMHRVRRFDDLKHKRDMRRTTTVCAGPTVAQQAA
jgi:alpha-ketoglutarate-dependent 2,4-dichlorophenoxyacetate dioxygenase